MSWARKMAMIGVVLALGATQNAMAGTIVVDDGGDDPTCSGFYNLRCAINYANANPFTSIRFAPGLPAVLLQGALPTITGNGTWIDGHDISNGCVCPRIDGAFWSGPAGSAVVINANDVTISNLNIIRIPAGGYGEADIAIAGGKDVSIAFDYLGILPGATGCGANQNVGVNISAFASGAAGFGNGAAYIYGSVISCHGGRGVNNGGNYVYIGQDRNGVTHGNYVGVASDGIHAAGNGGEGVYSGGDGVTIDANLIAFNAAGVSEGGNASFIDSNVISNNGGAGLNLYSGNNKTVVGNFVGTTSDGKRSAPNAGAGILIQAGSGIFLVDNTIAYNGLNGISVEGSATHALIEENDIFSNGGLPIDLGNDGFTPDGSSSGPGPNDWFPYPLIVNANGNLITGVSCAGCNVYVFKAIGDPSRPGGGGIHLSAALADSSGNWQATLPVGMTRTDVTFIASDLSLHDSSEMSPRDSIFRDGFE